MSPAGPPSSASRRRPSNRPQLTRTLAVRADLARTVPMTAEQRDRAVNAMAALLAATWVEVTEPVDEPKAA